MTWPVRGQRAAGPDMTDASVPYHGLSPDTARAALGAPTDTQGFAAIAAACRCVVSVPVQMPVPGKESGKRLRTRKKLLNNIGTSLSIFKLYPNGERKKAG